MKICHTMLCLFAAGCASYTQSKIDLTAQARSGVSLVRHDVEASRERSDVACDALRSTLDAAFDEDVNARQSLDAEWVIAHRKAYSLAIDAFDADRRSADTALQSTLRTLDAIDAALAQLQQMHAAEMRLTLPEVKR